MLDTIIDGYSKNKDTKRIDLPEVLFDYLIKYNDEYKKGTKKEQALKGLEKIILRLHEIEESLQNGNLVKLMDNSHLSVQQLVSHGIGKNHEQCVDRACKFFYQVNMPFIVKEIKVSKKPIYLSEDQLNSFLAKVAEFAEELNS